MMSGAKSFRGALQGGVVLEHRLGRGEALVLAQERVAPALQRDVVIVGHPVIAVDRPALLQKQLGQVKADEAGGPGDEGAPHLPTAS
jgi:hypothetical protein